MTKPFSLQVNVHFRKGELVKIKEDHITPDFYIVKGESGQTGIVPSVLVARMPKTYTITTRQLHQLVVGPETAVSRCAYVDLLNAAVDVQGRPLVGKATVYVSHAWDVPFGDVMEVVERHVQDNPDAYFWIDVLCSNLYADVDVASKISKTMQLVQSIGSVLVVMSPWSAPAPLTRLWCLWEMACALQHKHIALELKTPPSQLHMLQKALMVDQEALEHACDQSRIFEKADASSEEEKAMLVKMIRDMGVSQLAGQLKETLGNWYAEELSELYQEALTSDKGDLVTILRIFAKALDDFGAVEGATVMYQELLDLVDVTSHPSNHTKIIQLCTKLGKFHTKNGDQDGAIVYYSRALEMFVKSKVVLDSDVLRDVASVYYSLGNATTTGRHSAFDSVSSAPCMQAQHRATTAWACP